MLWVVQIVCFVLSLLVRLASILVNFLLTTLSWLIFGLVIAGGWWLETLRNRWFQVPIVQVVDCERCAKPREQAGGLEFALQNSRCSDTAYCNNIRRALNERIADLERELHKTKQELEHTSRFLRAAELQANEKRAKIRSLEEELRQIREDNNFAPQKSRDVREDREQLYQQNERLRAKNLQHWKRTLVQKQQAMKAQAELDERGEKIRLLATRCRKVQKELDEVRKQLQHQTRRADEQREARVRLEVENEGLRRPRTVAR
ncbi:hypothetical protein ANO14919_031560 [Xylariales sp. No.14919]|nr:hypothetical protein ANO14919_031560 [Xylariales sp. No.14919]